VRGRVDPAVIGPECPAPCAGARLRRLGIGIMLAFAVKGLITVGFIVVATIVGFDLL
jgi:hypothetical protein